MKQYKNLIIVAILVAILCVGVSVFIQTNTKKETEIVNDVKYFETPDRIVYKTKGQDKYYVFTSAKNDYDQLLNQLIKCIDGVGEGIRLSEEDMIKIEQEENYIELDYDTISKNYVIAYQKENYNVIKRTNEGGIVVKKNIQHREELEKMLEFAVKLEKPVVIRYPRGGEDKNVKFAKYDKINLGKLLYVRHERIQNSRSSSISST